MQLTRCLSAVAEILVSSVTDLRSLLVVLFFLATAPSFQNRMGMKFGKNVFHVNTHRLTSWIFDLTSDFKMVVA